MILPHPVQRSHLNSRRSHPVSVHLHVRKSSRHFQHSHLTSIILTSKRLSRQIHHSVTQMFHRILNVLVVDTLVSQQKIQARGLTHVSLQRLQRLLHSRKRRRTNNITQTINYKSTSPQRGNDLRKLLRQKVRRTNIPVDHSRRFLLLHAETVNEPHLPRIKVSLKTPTVQIHLGSNVFPGTASREVDSWPTIEQSSIHDLLGTCGHPRICLSK